MRWRARRQASSERGIAFIEFALVLPLLLAMGLGAVDLGRGLMSYMELEQAAQEGALYGGFAPSDHLLVTARVRDSSSGIVPLADPNMVEVLVVCPPDVPAGKIGLRLRYEMGVITPLVGPLLGGILDLRAESIGTNFTDAACEPTP